ncbi:MAG: hypothetical protein ABI574_08700 [Burkholderiales bacterium]
METIAAEAAFRGDEEVARKILELIPLYRQWPSPRDGAVMMVARGLIASGRMTSVDQCVAFFASEPQIRVGRTSCTSSFLEKGLVAVAISMAFDERLPDDIWAAPAQVARYVMRRKDLAVADELLSRLEERAERDRGHPLDQGAEEGRTIDKARDAIIFSYLINGFRARAFAVCQHYDSQDQIRFCRQKVVREEEWIAKQGILGSEDR